jgi:enamine deaminase RidA (YjgF/YER057c/UK114 family)
MNRTILNPPSLARPSGFSHGILTTGGQMLFLAGQTASAADGQIVALGDIVGQYEQVLQNLQTVVEAAGGTMQDLVKMTIFVDDRDEYRARLKELGKVHRAYFGNHYPATALLEISRFFQDGALIEIEGIAVLNS